MIKTHPFTESEFTMEADDTNGFSDLLLLLKGYLLNTYRLFVK